MKKYIACLLCLIFTACTNTADTKEINETAELAATQTTAKTVTQAITEITLSESQANSLLLSDEYSEDVKELARVYARVVCDMAANSDKRSFAAVGKEPDDIIGMRGQSSALCLIDIDFDGTPELFAGRRGMQYGDYSVFSSNGALVYSLKLIESPCDGYIYNGTIYFRTYQGCVKLSKGLPSLYRVYVTEPSDVEVTLETGETIRFQDLENEEIEKLYLEYLGVDYKFLHGGCKKEGTEIVVPDQTMISIPDIGEEECRKLYPDEENKFYTRALFYPSVEGFLRVPDPENYTEEDIYNCLAELLSEYEKISRLQEE